MKEIKTGFVKCKRCCTVKDRATNFRTDKIDYNCKECTTAIRKESGRTKHGVCLTMHSSQRQHSRTRGHIQPSYTPKELEIWLLSQKKFHIIYDEWVSTGYNKQMKPSCDRIEDDKPYSFDNIELKTYGENRSKYSMQKVLGIAVKNDCKPILQYGLDGVFIKEFHSIAQACRDLGVVSGAVSRVCVGRLQQHHGWVFKYKVSDSISRSIIVKTKRKPNKNVAYHG